MVSGIAPGAGSRPLSPEERYYAFLDQAWPMNIMIVAELDRVVPADEVVEAWPRFVRQRVLPRLCVTEDLMLVDAGTGGADVQAQELASADWEVELGRESQIPYGFDRPLRCRYLVSPDEERARLFFIGHHSIINGRIGVVEMQAFVRYLDGQGLSEQRELSRPPVTGSGFAWKTDRSARLAMLRAIAERRKAMPDPQPRDWPEAGDARRPRFATMNFDADASRPILDAAKVHGAGVNASLAAAWLVSVAALLELGDSPVLQLNTPVDIGVPQNDPERPNAVAIAVLGHRHRVGADAWTLAGGVATDVRASLRSGEGELFFELARVDRIDDVAAGVEAVRASVAAAPPAVSVTNLGVIDPGSDPPWLRSVCGHQAPTPNQVMFVSGVGYRGRLVNSVTTDDLRLPAGSADGLLDGFRRTITAMTG